MVKLSILLQIVIFALFAITNNYASSRRPTMLLVEEDGGARRNNRPAECEFGKQLKELGSTWYADLGPPFGVMYCLKCECVPVQKKRRIVARVKCRDIKNECPLPTCDEPVLLPGRCCKTCPNDFSPDVIQDASPLMLPEDEERSKYFAALLTGRTSYFLKREEMKSMYSTHNPQNIIASGRFSFHKKNLYYSFYVSDSSTRPKAIQFVDNTGNILEEQNLLALPKNGPFSIYQNATGKICGVWRRVPRDYRKLLREDQMSVVLIWDDGSNQSDFALAGPIGKYPAVTKEAFSALLEPASLSEEMNGAGGTAIVSISSGLTSSVYITIVFNGVFGSDDIYDVPLYVRLESLDKKHVILNETVKIKKPAFDINVAEIASSVSPNDLRLLSRGRLMVTVESKRKPNLRIQGNAVTRVSCDIFQTVLAPHTTDNINLASGLIWMYLKKDGTLVYNLHTDRWHEPDTVLTLIDESGKRKNELERVEPLFEDNFAEGVFERLGPRIFEPLYQNSLSVNVATVSELPIALKGRLIARPVADARDSYSPALFKRTHIMVPSNIAGMAWFAVDSDCILHYEITLTGVHNQQLELIIDELPIEAPGAPVTTTRFEEFTGNYLEGFVNGISSLDLVKLETNIIYTEIFSRARNESILRTRLKPIKIPKQCHLPYNINDVPFFQKTSNGVDFPPSMVEKKCFHTGRFYDNGQQWLSTTESCTMCSCVNERTICEAIKCPPLKCKTEDIVAPTNGACCPSCYHHKQAHTNTTHAVGCRLGDEFHEAGSSWHPYLQPNGFDECSTCTCDAITLEVSCDRPTCPPLTCHEKDAYRPDKKACCKKCPEIVQKSFPSKDLAEKGVLGDQHYKSKPKTDQEILSNGGCKAPQIYENGAEFHPVVASHGEQKCVICRCKDGELTCHRKRCTRSICNNKLTSKKNDPNYYQHGGHSTPIITDNKIDACCSHQCRRLRRHQANRRRKEKDTNLHDKTNSHTNSR